MPRHSDACHGGVEPSFATDGKPSKSLVRFLTLTPSTLLASRVDSTSDKVSLKTQEELARLSSSTFHRSSPVHPLLLDAAPPDLGTGAWRIHFLVTDDPFSLLGRLSNRSYPALELLTWFGIGMASIIFFLCKKNTLQREAIRQLLVDLGPSVWSHEVWDVSKGELIRSTLRRKPDPQGTLNHGAIVLNGTSPADLPGILQEFDHCFRDACAWASLYAPDEIEGYHRLRSQVESWIGELVWLHSDRVSNAPSTLGGYNLDNPLERAQLVMQRFDRIVQINAALSYVISQGFFGAPPIRHRAPLVGRYSLLGIGRAHRALVNIVRQIEYAFQRYSVPQSIHEKWGEAPALECPPSEWSFGSASWGARYHPDHLLQEATGDRRSTKLTYFSGRLGYRESEFSISAAIHALTCADSPEWHISTMTHEILHGHVRELLAAVLSPCGKNDPPLLADFWSHVFQRFNDHILGEPAAAFSLVDSVRSIIISYCCLTHNFGSLTRPPATAFPSGQESNRQVGEMRLPGNQEELRQSVAQEYKNLTEIIVHVLDLFYFYFDDFEKYSRSIWRSWRTVPVVLSDLRQYLLRMLLAYTSIDVIYAPNDHGDFPRRFSRARSQVLLSIERLNQELGGKDPVLLHAESVLRLNVPDGDNALAYEAGHSLFRPFSASTRIAHLARHCFASSKVKKVLFSEDLAAVSLGSGGLDYDLSSCQFSDTPIRSASQFIAWRARCHELTLGSDENAERLAAWLFVACGSLPMFEGKGR
jgi:hypothetical protein